MATEINDLIQDRLKTFLYSERQAEIGGTDGEITFKRVFAAESRIVVVLYRQGWGESSWTRIEREAIRERGHEYGYTFTIFIPLDTPATVPEWLPKAQIWVDLNRWGTKGAATIIEERVREQGGSPQKETVQERAVRLKRQLASEKERKDFLNSEPGLQAALSELDKIAVELNRLVGELKPTFEIEMQRAQLQMNVVGLGFGVKVGFAYKYSNTLDGSLMEISLWKGWPPLPGLYHPWNPEKLESIILHFDVTASKNYIWKFEDPKAHESALSSIEIASYAIHKLLDASHKKNLGK